MPELWNHSQSFSYISFLCLVSYLEEKCPQIDKYLALKMVATACDLHFYPAEGE